MSSCLRATFRRARPRASAAPSCATPAYEGVNAPARPRPASRRAPVLTARCTLRPFAPLPQDRVQVQYLDVTQPQDVAALVTRVDALAPADWRINLVNNAAVLPRTYSPANFDAAINTNVKCVRVGPGPACELARPLCSALPWL